MAAGLHDWQSMFIKQLHGFQNWINSYKMSVLFPELKRDLRQSHIEIRGDVLKIIRNELNALGPIKFRLTARIRLRKQVDLGGDKLSYFTRQENPILINTYNARAITEQLNAALDRQLEELAGWFERGSGWVVDAIEKFYLDFARNDPLRGGHYLPLPKDLKAKGAIINVKNKDNERLRWALRSAKFPVTKHPQGPSKYPTDDGLDFTGISFPTPLNEIPKVEKQNNLTINVLHFDNETKKVRILYVSEMKGENLPSYNVMLLTKGSTSHYCHIKNLSRLLYSQQHSEGHHYHYCIRDSETGAYCGKVHKHKQAPVKGDKPMSCCQYMMNIISTDKWHKRDYKTKKETLEEYPDESNCMNCGEPLLRDKFRMQLGTTATSLASSGVLHTMSAILN